MKKSVSKQFGKLLVELHSNIEVSSKGENDNKLKLINVYYLKKTVDLILAYSEEELTIDDIAHDTGLSRAGVYQLMTKKRVQKKIYPETFNRINEWILSKIDEYIEI